MDFRRVIWLLKAQVIVLAFILCLYGSSESFWPDEIFDKATTVLRTSWIQWTVCFLALVSSVGLGWLKGTQFRGSSGEDDACVWLIAALLIGGGAYFLQFPTASKTTQAMAWFCGMALGHAVAAQLRVSAKHRIDLLRCAVIVPVLLLSASSLASPGGMLFYYRGHSRWSGLWDTPNVFGLLMGAGLALAVGWFSEILDSKSGIPFRNTGSHSRGAMKRGLGILCLSAIILLGRGLFHSYSRGAWLGTAAGLVYLAMAAREPRNGLLNADFGNPHSDAGNPAESGKKGTRFQARSSSVVWLRHSRVSLFVILLSAFLLCFWHCRGTNWRLAHRAFSIVNTVDFSWRNRIAAWKGALWIMAEHPWLGAGWSQAENQYQNFYLDPKVYSSQAIEMNDFLLLGATLGLPALICFGMYLWLSLTGRTESRKSGKWRTNKLNLAADGRHGTVLPRTCRAGAVVLLVGFWFDGGLFALPTAATFWILLELGNVWNHETYGTHEMKLGGKCN